MQPYCQIAQHHPLHRSYHDHEYGFPQHEEAALFERLVLEINQAGLSWLTILKKRQHFRQAYNGFDVDTVAAMQAADVTGLLQNPGIVRQQRKIQAAIANAQTIQGLRQEFGGFYQWLCHHHPQSEERWVSIFRSIFQMTGPQVTREFLMSIGFLPGAHDPACAIYPRIVQCRPMWLQKPL